MVMFIGGIVNTLDVQVASFSLGSARAIVKNAMDHLIESLADQIHFVASLSQESYMAVQYSRYSTFVCHFEKIMEIKTCQSSSCNESPI